MVSFYLHTMEGLSERYLDSLNKTGIPIDSTKGYPVFDDVALHDVIVEDLKGNRTSDFTKANAKAGILKVVDSLRTFLSTTLLLE